MTLAASRPKCLAGGGPLERRVRHQSRSFGEPYPFTLYFGKKLYFGIVD
jgi:hypothetical protein